MKVLLSNRGNPDFRQDHTRNLLGTPKDKFVAVDSIEHASAACIQYIDENDLGMGNWTGGHVVDEQMNLICYIGYNGRAFNGKQELDAMGRILKSRMSHAR
jgi:hypothetical protein